MKSMINKTLYLFLILFVCCGDDEDRQEVVKSIRGVGSKVILKGEQKPFLKLSDLLVLKQEDEFTLEIFVLVPKDKEIKASIFQDDEKQAGAILSLGQNDFIKDEVDIKVETDLSETGFVLYKLSSQISGQSLLSSFQENLKKIGQDSSTIPNIPSIPSDNQQNPFNPEEGFKFVLKVRYGFKVEITNLTEEEEKDETKRKETVVGDIMIADEKTTLYDSQLVVPKVTIIDLEDQYKRSKVEKFEDMNSDDKVEKILLKVNVTKAKEKDDENDNYKKDKRKIHWFISDGKIDNFRSKETKWVLPEKNGKFFILVGSYGLRSRLFNYDLKIVEITD